MAKTMMCRKCQAVISDPGEALGSSPFCEGCGTVMCRDCERKHDKELCKIESRRFVS